MHTYQVKTTLKNLFDLPYTCDFSTTYDLEEAVKIARDEATKKNQYRNIIYKENQYIIVSTSDYYAHFSDEKIVRVYDHKGNMVEQ
jgi:hypothetical protein